MKKKIQCTDDFSGQNLISFKLVDTENTIDNKEKHLQGKIVELRQLELGALNNSVHLLEGGLQHPRGLGGYALPTIHASVRHSAIRTGHILAF